MAMTFLGLPNILSEDYVTFSTDGFAGLVPAGLEASYLKTEEPSEITRLALLDPKHTHWLFDLAGVQKDFSGFALVNHNLAPGSLVRFQSESRTLYTQAPNAIVSSTNITGTVTNVDEAIDSPDGNIIEPTNKANSWEVHFGWAALSVTPKLGSHMGQIVLRMKRNFTGAGADNPLTYPKLTIDLQQSGGTVRALGTRAVTSTDTNGQIFIYTFDFSELAAPDGSNIEVGVTCTSGTSASGGQYATLESIALYYEDENQSLDKDSLWIEIPEPDSMDLAPTKSIHYLTSDEWTSISGGVIRIISDQSLHDPPTTHIPIPTRVPVGGIRTFPVTYIDVGVAVGSGRTEMLTGIQSEGPQVNVEIEEIVGNTLGGQTYGADSFRRRVCEATSIVVNRAEKDFLMKLLWERGHSGAFYIILETGVTFERQLFTAFWATLKSLSTPRQLSAWHPGDEIKYSMTIAFEEKL